MPKSTTKTSNGANLGFEQTLWKAADKMRGSMDPSEYKHVALGLMFLKYISDGFEEHYQKLVAQSSSGADPEDRDEYNAENVFWVPQNARWTFLKNNAKQPNIGNLIDDAIVILPRKILQRSPPSTTPGNPVLDIPTSPAFAIPLPSKRFAPRTTLSLLGGNVGASEIDEDDEPVIEKNERLKSELFDLFDQNTKLESEINKQMGKLQFDKQSVG